MGRPRINVRSDLLEGRNVRPLDVARDLNISPATIYAKIKRGELDVIAVGRAMTITNASGRRLYGLAEPEAA